ncbi:MAG: hypothetical protein E6600_13750 [Anaerocolumna aminovalerica]|uniref:hypothetical protein n=1 Tax=Anaerocolumna aminovalerica TaxID=1527 RepID=UPI00290A34BE|nr:hypothetical protein [Anaerocolumna aminovalerica]MDU6265557.1 hypothetical protein [Anaerocolumna aminovalerica]
MKKFKSLFLVFFLALTFVFSGTEAFAAENYNSDSIIQIEKETDDANLSRKESVIKFMNQHPEYKDEVMKILNDKGALNADGSIKDDLGISNTPSIYPASLLYNGYLYTLEGHGPSYIDYPKEIIAKYTNNTSSSKNFSVSQSYTATTTFSYENSIGSKAKLEEVYEISSGVKLGYTYTESATTQYGTQVSVPAYTTGTLKASPLKDCYAFHEQYYVLGVAVGNTKVVGVFKPTGVHWFYSESKN